MQVSVANRSEFSRVATITVPASDFDKEYNKSLKQLSRTRKIPGFRPGNLPKPITERYFGSEAMKEALNSITDRNYREYLKEKQPNLACRPTIQLTQVEFGKDLIFDLSYDEFAEFELKSLEDLQVTRTFCEITDNDVNDVISNIQRQLGHLEDVAEGTAVENGDFLKINSSPTIDGEPVSEYKLNNASIVVGTGEVIPGFSDQLLGHKNGEKFEFELKLPDTAPEKYREKIMKFEVEITEHRRIVPHEINSELFKLLKLKETTTVELFRDEIRRNITRERDNLLSQINQARVFKALREANPVAIPDSAVKERAEAIYDDIFGKQKNPSLKRNDAVKVFGQRAESLVRDGLLMDALTSKYEIKVTEQSLDEYIHRIASAYEEPEQVFHHLKKDRRSMANFGGTLALNSAVDLVFSKAQVTQENVEFGKLADIYRSL
ncbi:MAG: trigger factor [Succinivibrionaceae bacterium]|nr:trigger factor [Succinivibrionaceae bacterium]